MLSIDVRNFLSGPFHLQCLLTDLLRLQADNPVYVIGELWKQETVEGLASLRSRATRMLVDLVESGARPSDAARLTTAYTDALTQRLLQMAEETLGPPPVPYAWMALGSQARHEQTAHSDQDHALLLDDDATADRWRQSLSDWKTTFGQWIEEPEPDALMHASIFFDLRHVHGTATLTDALHQFILDRTPNRSLFLACLAADALKHRPPLGFFRQFVLSTHGEHEDTLDLKHDGLVPIVDLDRRHLKDAFRIVKTAQSAIEQRYQTSLIS